MRKGLIVFIYFSLKFKRAIIKTIRKGVDNINRNKYYILGTIFALIMCISGIYAITFTANTTVENDIRTGGVNIKIDEYLVNDGQEVEYTQDEKLVVPGQKIQLIPRISNLGASCYVRVKLSYTFNGNTTNLTEEAIGEMSSDWKKIDNYWYYTQPVQHNAKLDVFKYLVVPKNLTNEDKGKKIQFNIIADAIQSANINPDFDSTQPWGDTEIIKNNNSEYVMEKVQVSDAVKVEYDSTSSQILNVPDDFMTGLSELMPGNEMTYTITTKPNPYNALYLFKILPNDENDAQVKDLLQKLQLIVQKDGETVYTGNMNVETNKTLGSCDPYQTSTFTVTVKMPETLNNDYAMRRALIKWFFSAELTQKDEPTPDNYTNTYSVDVVKVSDDGKTTITSDEAIFEVNGKEFTTTKGKAENTIKKLVTSEAQEDTIVIKENQAPKGFNKFNGTISLKVGFKFDETIRKFVIDSNKIVCTAPEGSSSGIYKVSAEEQKITVYVTNKQIIPAPEGKYTVELVKVAEDGSTVLSDSESVFTINDSNISTTKGKIIVSSDKIISNVSQTDTYKISEKTAPKGYKKYGNEIVLKVAFKKDEKNNTYVIDEKNTSIKAPGLSGNICKISGDKITIYVPNTKIKEEKSPQTGDVKVKIAIAVFVIAAISLIVVFVVDRKSKEK